MNCHAPTTTAFHLDFRTKTVQDCLLPHNVAYQNRHSVDAVALEGCAITRRGIPAWPRLFPRPPFLAYGIAPLSSLTDATMALRWRHLRESAWARPATSKGRRTNGNFQAFKFPQPAGSSKLYAPPAASTELKHDVSKSPN